MKSCKSFVEVTPPKTDLVTDMVFDSDNTATAAMINVYSKLVSDNFASGNANSVTYCGGLSADEMDIFFTSSVLNEFYNNRLRPDNATVTSGLWTAPYEAIYKSNAIIEGLLKSSNVTSSLKSQLIGEAKFVRAFSHFLLVNLFGDIPLVLTTDYKKNAVIPRTPVEKVYEQILNDLIDAKSLLSDDYSFSNGERVRPNKWAASALLARVYLYMQRWRDAEREASEIISNTALFSLPSPDEVFKKNSIEAIWQLIRDNYNTNEALLFTITGNGPTGTALKKTFVSLFDLADARRTKWIDSVITENGIYYYPSKYKDIGNNPITEYSVVFRLGEQYLVRAEARARQNMLIGPNSAVSDINFLRTRAGIGGITASSLNDIMSAIEKERQFELFTEWGHRWLDLKRWPSINSPGDNTASRADDVLSAIKVGWRKEAKLYPIPQVQILNNPAMANAQNPGYE